MRAWLFRNAGVICVALGWACAIGAIAIPKTHEYATAFVEFALFGGIFLGFGIAWLVRDDVARKDGGRR